MKIALFPGSFDPVTLGHVEIAERACKIFDKVIIGIGENVEKKSMFPVEKRLEWLKKVFAKNKQIEVQSYKGLTVNFAEKLDAQCIVRGLREASDYDFEKDISQLNRHMKQEIDTVFFIASPSLSHIKSSIVRDIIRNKGNLKGLVPEEVRKEISP